MKRTQRKLKEQLFIWTCRAATWMAIAILFTLLFHVVREGIEWLDLQFLDSFPSRKPEQAGIKSALWGSVWLIGLTAMISIPLSIGSALYLEEYAPQNRWTRIVEINLANLAGLPSILYGLLGLAIFVRYFGLESSLWSGSLTLSLLVLPVVVIAAKGAIRSVPLSIREGAYALGARRWQVVFYQVLPSALPGIMTGIILGSIPCHGRNGSFNYGRSVELYCFSSRRPIRPLHCFAGSNLQLGGAATG